MNSVKNTLESYYRITGRKPPAHTDLDETYDWRYATLFTQKVKELGISEELASQIIFHAIKYLLNIPGMKFSWSRLLSDDIIEAALNRMEATQPKSQSWIDDIASSHRFARKNGFKFSDRINGVSNLARWYDSGKISLSYVAVSKDCREALRGTKEVDRCLLPSNEEISKRRTSCFVRDEVWKQIKRILGSHIIKI